MKHLRILIHAKALGLLLVILLVYVATAFGQGGLGQPIPIDNSRTITEPGSYILHRVIFTGTPLIIRADNVSLDLNGQTMSGPGSKQGTGISVEGVRGVRIHNGRVAGFGIGVQVLNSNNVRIENLQISGEDLGGPPPGEIGVLIINSRAVLVKDNLISRLFLGIFVRGGGSGGNRIANNTLTGGRNGALGICYNPSPTAGASDGPSGDLVYNNLISRFETGIATSARSVRNIFRDNDIAYFTRATMEEAANTNTFANNTTVQIVP